MLRRLGTRPLTFFRSCGRRESVAASPMSTAITRSILRISVGQSGRKPRFLSTTDGDKNVKGGQEINQDVGNVENDKSSTSAVTAFDPDEYDDYEEPRTAGEKVAAYSALFLRLGFLAAGVVCIYFTVKELFPGRMGPHTLFTDVFEIVKINDEVKAMTGDSMKAFGRESGRRARRNHVDSRKYKEIDGSNRTRIRFNVEGSKGRVMVWAEVSDRMAANEYVYIVCQDMRNGRVYTIEDNRARLDAEMAAHTDDNKDAMSALLGIFKR